MSRIAQRITGLTSAQLLETDFKSIHSIEEICDNERCLDPHIYAGLITASCELNNEREKLRNNIPKAFIKEGEG